MFKCLKIIVCCDKHNGIGKENTLPWNIPSEMKQFKDKTIGNGFNCVIMGKNTFLSIPKNHRPLYKRHSVVVTQDETLKEEYGHNPNITFLSCPNDVITFLQMTVYDDYWLIGGKMMYEYFLQHYLKYLSEIHLSILPQDYDCDTFLNLDKYITSFEFVNETKHKLFDCKRFKNKECL